MSYPTIDGPYGLKPVNILGGQVDAGSTRMVPIASGYAANLFYGDIVQLSAGTAIITTMSAASSPATPVAGTIGVFMGCEYTVPATQQRIRSQYWPTGTVAQDAVAYVLDDPRAVFKAAVITQGTSLANTGTTIGYMSQNFVGTNAYVVAGNAGSTASGNSALALSGGVVTNGTGNTRVATLLPFRIVQLVPDTVVTVAAQLSSSAVSASSTVVLAQSGALYSPAITAGMQLICTATGATGCLAGNFLTVTNVNGATLTVSANVTIPANSQLSFVGYPEVLVTWNQTFHSYTNTAGV